MRKRRAIPPSLRFAVLERDGFSCRYCGNGPPDVPLEVDHAFPHSRGGSDDIDNLVTACEDCNAGKSNWVLRFNIPEQRRHAILGALLTKVYGNDPDSMSVWNFAKVVGRYVFDSHDPERFLAIISDMTPVEDTIRAIGQIAGEPMVGWDE